jgi:hypothetical protein
MRLSDQLNRSAEQEMIVKLGEVLEVNILTGDELRPFQELSASVYEYFIKRGIVTHEDIQRAIRLARGDEGTGN